MSDASPALTDEDQALRDELATWLMACDECIGNDAPEDYLDHERSFLRRLRHNVHSGDCTKESHSCVRCQCDTYLANADALLRGPLATLRARATAAEAALLELRAKAEEQVRYWHEKQARETCPEDRLDDDGIYTPMGDEAAMRFGACNGRYSEADWWLKTIAALAPPEPIPATEDEASDVSGS